MAETKKTEEVKKAPAKRAPAKKKVEPKVEIPKAEEPKKVSANLKDTTGKSVKDEDYFFQGVIPPGFLGTCGKPVEKEDLVEVFNKIFRPEDGILFYKQQDKEVYLIIVPIRYSTEIGKHNDSIIGDFQKHAISFLNEGSVNQDTLKHKLERIKKFVKYNDR